MAILKNPLKNYNESPLGLGARGELLALKHLERIGYCVVATNFTTPIGFNIQGRPITGEIDLIAYDERQTPHILAFVEVKTRSKIDYATPQSAVDRQKQRHIIKVARIYRRLLKLENAPFRYDVASVLLAPGTLPQIQILTGYFSEQIFVKSRWYQQPF
jgi:putative endonuclease